MFRCIVTIKNLSPQLKYLCEGAVLFYATLATGTGYFVTGNDAGARVHQNTSITVSTASITGVTA